MRYRLAFERRLQSDGRESTIDPTLALDSELADGVVAEKVFVARLEPEAQHSQEVLDEDDAFLALAATDLWEYEIIDSRAAEFQDAIRNSEVVFEYTIVDDSETEADELTQPQPGDTEDVGDPSGDEAGVGQSTGDPSAGGMSRAHSQVEGSSRQEMDGTGGIDDLTILDENTPDLGLTHPGDQGADWAANAGPAHTPGRGIQTRDLTDRSSTLRPSPAPPNSAVPRKGPSRRNSRVHPKSG